MLELQIFEKTSKICAILIKMVKKDEIKFKTLHNDNNYILNIKENFIIYYLQDNIGL